MTWLKTKSQRGWFALCAALVAHVAFYAWMTDGRIIPMLAMGLGFPAGVAALGYFGYRVSKWIEQGDSE